MTTKHPRDPKTQPQIGEAVTYLPEGVVTKVTGYEWEAPTGDLHHAPKIKRYVLACGVTVIADHIAQGSDATPVAEKADQSKYATGGVIDQGKAPLYGENP